ncbi:MAG TPA: hypothetical protein VGM03_14725 [Phycisphaerae bacterium]|jgi:hypothetical protein
MQLALLFASFVAVASVLSRCNNNPGSDTLLLARARAAQLSSLASDSDILRDKDLPADVVRASDEPSLG